MPNKAHASSAGKASLVVRSQKLWRPESLHGMDLHKNLVDSSGEPLGSGSMFPKATPDSTTNLSFTLVTALSFLATWKKPPTQELRVYAMLRFPCSSSKTTLNHRLQEREGTSYVLPSFVFLCLEGHVSKVMFFPQKRKKSTKNKRRLRC